MTNLKTKIFESIGEASMCWNPLPEGVFDSTHANRIGDSLMEAMDAAREDEAVGFAEWTQRNYYEQDDSGFWYKWAMRSKIKDPSYNTSELYQLYKNEKL